MQNGVSPSILVKTARLTTNTSLCPFKRQRICADAISKGALKNDLSFSLLENFNSHFLWNFLFPQHTVAFQMMIVTCLWCNNPSWLTDLLLVTLNRLAMVSNFKTCSLNLVLWNQGQKNFCYRPDFGSLNPINGLWSILFQWTEMDMDTDRDCHLDNKELPSWLGSQKWYKDFVLTNFSSFYTKTTGDSAASSS